MNSPTPKPGDFIEITARHCGGLQTEIRIGHRFLVKAISQCKNEARQIFSSILRDYGFSYTHIGELTNRNRATILYHCRRDADDMQYRPAYRNLKAKVCDLLTPANLQCFHLN